MHSTELEGGVDLFPLAGNKEDEEEGVDADALTVLAIVEDVENIATGACSSSSVSEFDVLATGGAGGADVVALGGWEKSARCCGFFYDH
jgi:hypothetical protein